LRSHRGGSGVGVAASVRSSSLPLPIVAPVSLARAQPRTVQAGRARDLPRTRL
jgi:hypothetical protein